MAFTLQLLSCDDHLSLGNISTLPTNQGKRIYVVIYKVVVETNPLTPAFHFGILKSFLDHLK